METYTLREAADLTGLTYEALRSRVDRGQIRALAPGRGRTRRIPRSELESAGLNVEPRPASTASVVSELLSRLEEQAGEMVKLRQLEARAGSLVAEVEMERIAKQQNEAEINRLRAQIETAASAPFWKRRRLLISDLSADA